MADKPLMVPLDPILDFITDNVYDPGHGFLTPQPDWNIPAESLLDRLCELANISKEEMGKRFDKARKRVHGPDVDKPKRKTR